MCKKRSSFLTYWCLLTILLCNVSCGQDNQEEVPLEEINIELDAARLDLDMLKGARDLKEKSGQDPMKWYQKYFNPHTDFLTEFLFAGQESMATPENLALAMKDFLADPLSLKLLDTISVVYPEGIFNLQEALGPVMKRFNYYFPERDLPRFRTFVDGYPPSAQSKIHQIVPSGRYIGIGLHYFLGPEFRYYPGDLPLYARRRCTSEHIPALVVHEMANIMVSEPDITQSPKLVDHIIAKGIKMYMIDKLLGQTPDSVKLLYTAKQVEWATFYEPRIYKELLPNLYSMENILVRRYTNDSPFTSSLSRESAPRIGWYIGWRIVKAYMAKHPETTLEQLIKRKDYQKLLQESGYRPPKNPEGSDQ